MRGTDWEVTQWGGAISDSGNDEYTGKSILLPGPSCPKIRVFVDGELYAVIIARNERAAEEAHQWMETHYEEYGSTHSTIRRAGETEFSPFIG